MIQKQKRQNIQYVNKICSLFFCNKIRVSDTNKLYSLKTPRKKQGNLDKAHNLLIKIPDLLMDFCLLFS